MCDIERSDISIKSNSGKDINTLYVDLGLLYYYNLENVLVINRKTILGAENGDQPFRYVLCIFDRNAETDGFVRVSIND